MRKIKEAQAKLSIWDEQIFGETETVTEDGKEYTKIKQHEIPRSVADLKKTALYKTAESEIDEKKQKLKVLEDTMEKTKDEHEYQNLQKELSEIAESIVEVRDGEFGEYLGYAPVFKTKDLDYTATAANNVALMGRGELNAILLDFNWNRMQFDYGQNQLSLPVYDKKLWMGEGFIEPPTLRGVASLVCDIAGAATGQSWWLGLVDDALFSVMDIGIEGKDAGEVALSFAKSAVMNELSAGIGAAGNGIGKAVEKIGSTAGKIAANAAWSATSSYVTSVAGSYVNSLNYSAEGGWSMNWEEANQSWYSANTVAGTVSSALTAGLNTGTAAKLKSMGDKGAAIQKFYGGAINIGVSAAGKAAEYGVHAAYSLAQGGTLKDAYDNMGGISVNVLNLGAIADMIGSGISRNDAGGQANRWSELAQKLGGAGVLEINFGSDGISGKIGSGGIDLGGNLYTFAKRMNDRARLESYGQNHSQAQSDAAYWAYVYGDWTQENTAARIASDKDVLEIVSGDGKPAGWTAQTVQNGEGNGRIIQMLDSGDKHINAILLGHEAYRDGFVTGGNSQKAETIQAVLAHSAMADRMTQYNNKLTGSLALEAALYKAGRTDLLAALADGMYDSSADYWKLMSDGTLVQDEDGWLKDENIIKDKDGNKIGADGQETGLLNILFAKQADGSYKNPGKKYDEFSPLEKIISAQIMEKSGISHYYKDEEKTGICDRSWNLDGKALDMNLVMGYA